MDTLGRFNEALNYMEENLTSTVDYKEVARIACCSEYHFTRMFALLAGVTLSEYIRRRRLTLAGLELNVSDSKVIDVALKYGYASPDAFARAFQNLHGITPSEARSHDRSLKAYPRMTFQLTIRGGSEMNYRMEDKPAFRIVGTRKRVPLIFHGVNPDIQAMYERLTPEWIQTVKGLSNVQPSGLISASTNFSENRMDGGGELDYYIGAATTKDAPGHMVQLEVPASVWAVFTVVGPFPSTLQEAWGRIYAEWLPSMEYEVSEGPEIVWNESTEVESPQFKSEIWIPVKKRG
ncbi:AraC family transcriptional regulator [Cohnella soli]|uniref:GyrI-like domain-containing protein n=1 Tax=Cohnella soli TaxID=425005 RepID=A0ABW0HRP9_9BACL